METVMTRKLEDLLNLPDSKEIIKQEIGYMIEIKLIIKSMKFI